MDELSPLFQEIEFHERFRGYDPDEVDAYVDRIAKAAALVQGRLTALQERVDAAEARLDAGGGSEAESMLTRVVAPVTRSWTKTSDLWFESPATRLSAVLVKAT